MAISSASAWLAGSGSSRSYNPNRGAYTFTLNAIPPVSTPVTTSPVTPPDTAGIQPEAIAAQLYGHTIPIFVGGRMLIGGRIIEGPWFGGTPTDPTVTFVAYHALSIANDRGAAGLTQTVATQARLHAQEVWNSTSGYIATDKLPSGKFDWRPGHYAQNPFAQSVVRFGANAIAYTEGIITSWQDIPLKPFGGYVPMPSLLVENSRFGDPDDGIPRSDAIGLILDYMRLASGEYEVDVSGSEPAVMIAAGTSLEEFLKNLRSLFPTWEISYKDKIRIVEPTGFTVSAPLTNRNILRNTIKFRRTDPLIVPRETRYKYIDVDRDYEFNVAVAKEDLQPIPTSFATNTRSIELPFATTAAAAVAEVHVSHYEEQAARFGMDVRVNPTLFGIEPGDGVSYSEGVHDFSGQTVETGHDFGNWSVGIRAVERVKCEAESDPHFGSVILLMHCDGSPGSTSFTDSSGYAHTLTAQGNAQVSASSKFGTGALLCDGTGDGVFTGVTALSSVGLSPTNTSPYTIECWAEFNAINRVQFLVAVDLGFGGRYFRLYQNGDDELVFEWGNASSFIGDVTTTAADLVTGVDYFIVVDKDSTGKIRIYVNGIMQASDTPADSRIGAHVEPIMIGKSFFGSSFDGLFDEVRITRGISRYGDVGGDASFTPPTAAFPDR